jgi:hypothetical protein
MMYRHLIKNTSFGNSIFSNIYMVHSLGTKRVGPVNSAMVVIVYNGERCAI